MNKTFSNLQTGLLVCVFLICCKPTNKVQPNGIAVIDVVNNLGKYQAIPVSEIVSELEYIPLETTGECLVGRLQKIIITNTHIFIWTISPGKSLCYAFSRNGRFIREIGRFGQGPGEHQGINNIFVDEENRSIYIEDNERSPLLEYSWEGVFIQSVNKPQYRGFDGVSYIRDNLFIGHVRNYIGDEVYKFILFDKTGQAVKSFNNYELFEWKGGNMYATGYMNRAISPFRVSERVYVKEITNDTLYFLNEHLELIPQFAFNLGKYAFPTHFKEDVPSSLNFDEGIIHISSGTHSMVGTPSHIFFEVLGAYGKFSRPKGRVRTDLVMGEMGTIGVEATPLGIYDISKKTTRLLDTDPVSRMLGFINDLDGGMSFWPKYYTYSNEVVDYFQPYEMKKILTEEYFASHEIKNLQAHQKLKELLKNLDEDDNPVIVIGKLKKTKIQVQ